MNYQILEHSNNNRHWIMAFYGYGQQAKVYHRLANLCKGRVGFIVIDLPYHETKQAPSKEDFASFIADLMKRYAIEKITGISYSIGSRYNLILAELMPASMVQLILIAPDGVSINFWNRVATSTWLGQSLFHFLMYHQAFYVKLLTLFHTIHLLPSALYTFSKWHVRNPESSRLVYQTWMQMKHMIPDLKKINQQQQLFSFPIKAYFGNKDVIIKPQTSHKLKKEIPATDIFLIDKGHDLLNEELFPIIASYI
ncbi:MAG: alpha/beta hydrolase [Bacteroidetes bacterium]|nr:alpha/beta hydrolase [Bacteroidota bacterium]